VYRVFLVSSRLVLAFSFSCLAVFSFSCLAVFTPSRLLLLLLKRESRPVFWVLSSPRGFSVSSFCLPLLGSCPRRSSFLGPFSLKRESLALCRSSFSRSFLALSRLSEKASPLLLCLSLCRLALLAFPWLSLGFPLAFAWLSLGCRLAESQAKAKRKPRESQVKDPLSFRLGFWCSVFLLALHCSSQNAQNPPPSTRALGVDGMWNTGVAGVAKVLSKVRQDNRKAEQKIKYISASFLSDNEMQSKSRDFGRCCDHREGRTL
jgi:hypothetical protein